MPQLIYLASPYSHPEEAVREARFVEACKAAGALMKAGLNVFSPIAHNHPIVVAGELSQGWEFWNQYDLAYLPFCAGLLVLALPGWEASVGVDGEIRAMRELGRPVRHYVLADILEAPYVVRADVERAVAESLGVRHA